MDSSQTQAPDVLAAYGWSERVAAMYTDHEPGRVAARVVRVDRTGCLAVTETGIQFAHLTGQATAPVTGDWVALRTGPDTGPGVEAVLERWSEVSRLDPNEAARQVLAANVDLIVLVHGFDRPIRRSRIERLLVLAWESGATPVVVLNKIDLAEDRSDPMDVPGALSVLGAIAPGVDVIAASATTGEGIESVRRLLAPGRTVAFIGESGVGKSSLVNALAGTEILATGPVRDDRKGRHTTTARELIPLPGGAVLMDTPGLRSIALIDGTLGMARTFADVEERAGGCRFRDCRHRDEPGCAVQEAVDAGLLDPGRLDRYRRLGRQIAHEQRRAEVRARRAAAKTGGYRRPRKHNGWDEEA